MAVKNNVTRMLEAENIQFSPHELPNKKLSALEVAEVLSVGRELVFKTIVALRPGNGKPVLALVPATHELDLKSLGRALGEKKVSLASQRQAESVTGLQTGGISPLALLHKGFTVIIDRSIELHSDIYISGGQRGLNISIPTKSLVKLTKTRLHPLTRKRTK